MTKRQSTVIAFLSVLIIILAFMLSGRVWFRLDLTKNKAYTISDVSRNLYREIPDPVSITYYISDRLDQAHPVPGEIADLLQEYASRSRGMIRFTRKDPAKANISAEVEGLGIPPQQIQVVEKNEATIATVYTGILIEYLDKIEVLPVVFSLDNLEYDITSRIRTLVRGSQREIGFIVGDSSKTWENDYVLLYREFAASGYRTRVITPGDEIPAGLPCLFVLGGAAELDEWALYRIDHYIQSGGKVLFAVDGVNVDMRGSLEAVAVSDMGLLAMLANYGALIRPVMALDRSALNVQFEIQTGNMTQIRLVRYPEWIGVLEQNGNKNHPILFNFAGVDLYWPSPVELSPPADVKAEVLFSSTADAWLQTQNFITNPDMISLFQQEAAQTTGTKVFAAALSGVFPGFFAGVPRPVREGSEEILPDMPVVPAASRIVVVGDTDFAGSLMQVTRGESRNLDFLLKAAGWLSSDDDIMSIRNRSSGGGRLDKIEDPDKKAAAMTFSRTLNVFVIPLLVIAAGLYRGWKRNRRTAGKEMKDGK
jgi:ABC-type uncharacterized transport system involved in gliding motility auxiliary subunit